MAYRIAQEIAARCVTLYGDVDAIILTAGLAHSETLTGWIQERCRFIGEVKRYPGENELQALAEGTLRVLRGEELARTYDVQQKKIGLAFHQSSRTMAARFASSESRFRYAATHLPLITTRRSTFCCRAASRTTVRRPSGRSSRPPASTFAVMLGSPAAVAMKSFLKRSETRLVCLAWLDPGPPWACGRRRTRGQEEQRDGHVATA